MCEIETSVYVFWWVQALSNPGVEHTLFLVCILRVVEELINSIIKLTLDTLYKKTERPKSANVWNFPAYLEIEVVRTLVSACYRAKYTQSTQ